MKVSIIGDSEAVKLKVDQYKFAFKSVNLLGFSSLIENLIQFRERSNPYVDSMLGIANSKSKFKIIKKCDPLLVEAVRRATCLRFRLNHDQEFVLNECTKWFLPKETKTAILPAKQEKENDLDIIGIEDALSDSQEEDNNLKALEMQAKQADANVVLVHGAFGCGKSYLLVAIIRFVCTLLDQIGEEETKILVCALTNVAVDRILLTLKEQEFTDFARVGSLKKINK